MGAAGTLSTWDFIQRHAHWLTPPGHQDGELTAHAREVLSSESSQRLAIVWPQPPGVPPRPPSNYLTDLRANPPSPPLHSGQSGHWSGGLGHCC